MPMYFMLGLPSFSNFILSQCKLDEVIDLGWGKIRKQPITWSYHSIVNLLYPDTKCFAVKIIKILKNKIKKKKATYLGDVKEE